MVVYYWCHVQLQNNILVTIWIWIFVNYLNKIQRKYRRQKWYFEATQEKPKQKILSVKPISHQLAFKRIWIKNRLGGGTIYDKENSFPGVAVTVIIFSSVSQTTSSLCCSPVVERGRQSRCLRNDCGKTGWLVFSPNCLRKKVLTGWRC